jgi:hypothetical protein
MELLRARDRPVDALRVVASVPVDIAPERVRIIEELLAVVDVVDHADVVGRAHFAAANCELERSNFASTLSHARAAADIFGGIGDDRLVGWASFMGSFGAWGTGDTDAARQSIHDAEEHFTRNDDRSGLANASWAAIMLEPDLGRALERGRRAEAQLRHEDSPFALLHCLEAIALAELLADLPADAAPRLSEALRLGTDLRVSGCAAHTIEAVAACVAAVAEPANRAAIAELLGAAEELRVATGHRHRPWELGGHRAALSILRTSMTEDELDAAIARGRGHRLASAAELGQRTLSRFFPDPRG